MFLHAYFDIRPQSLPRIRFELKVTAEPKELLKLSVFLEGAVTKKYLLFNEHFFIQLKLYLFLSKGLSNGATLGLI